MKIMIAEDDRNLLQLFSTLLRTQGHQTVQALDASQVLSTAMRETPDLILLDITMPGGKGTDLLVRLKRSSLTAGIPVIVISSTQDQETRTFVQDQGGEGFIAKPVKKDSFIQQLKSVAPHLPWG